MYFKRVIIKIKDSEVELYVSCTPKSRLSDISRKAKRMLKMMVDQAECEVL